MCIYGTYVRANLFDECTKHSVILNLYRPKTSKQLTTSEYRLKCSMDKKRFVNLYFFIFIKDFKKVVFNLLLGFLFLRILQQFNPLDDLFLHIVVASLLIFVLQLFVNFKKNILNNSTLNVLILSSMLFFVTAQSTVLTIDRSRSFYVLSWVKAEKINVTDNGLDFTLIQSEEKNSNSAIELRLKEQVDRKLVHFNSGKYSLTMLGSGVLLCADSFAKVFNLSGWYQNKY